MGQRFGAMAIGVGDSQPCWLILVNWERFDPFNQDIGDLHQQTKANLGVVV